ncbi:MAG: pilus assembly protein, partial [Propionibacteriaceae bacterium]|nr:pilus assembly protein [Propionibacteriaceae bacterium]
MRLAASGAAPAAARPGRGVPTGWAVSRGGRERGSVTLETVILFPLVMLVTVGAIQLGLWFYARSVCL